ncbi:MAG: L-threonylcarbamoyladenylate synthase [Bacteroidales bacterium]|nr:L-threonylcarbamoyladenylate synthase [Bacteroidales bacterium]MDD4603034.1 L-threonylcarbamoyladenylate synthase [Bacteroidales bacterium]
MESEIRHCLKVLKAGGTLLYPTDTIWGIGCDATNFHAVEKVYRLKKRMESKSLIILLDDVAKLTDYVVDVPDIAWDLLKSVDSPLTIIYAQSKNLASNVVAKDQSIAIRIVKNEFCRLLIESFGKPIVSTSANISGERPPLGYKNIDEEIIKGVDYAVDPSIGVLQQIKPSRIIRLGNNGEFQIIRK